MQVMYSFLDAVERRVDYSTAATGCQLFCQDDVRIHFSQYINVKLPGGIHAEARHKLYLSGDRSAPPGFLQRGHPFAFVQGQRTVAVGDTRTGVAPPSLRVSPHHLCTAQSWEHHQDISPHGV